MKRRLFLKSAMAGSAVATAVGAGLLTPSMVFAIQQLLKLSLMQQVLHLQVLVKVHLSSKRLKSLRNGAVVPMTVDASKMDGVTNISFYVKNNGTYVECGFNRICVQSL
jgi:sulfur-oxidizing protein SoxY